MNGAIVDIVLNVSKLPPLRQKRHNKDIIIASIDNDNIKIMVEIVNFL